MKFFQWYQFVAPVILFPLSYWLWWQRYAEDHRMVLAALSLPIVFAYVIPGIGTNWLRLWEFNTRIRLGRFRPHHGLVFGSATSLFALLSLPDPSDYGVAGLVRDGFVLGSVLAFWNWLYDTYAIKAGYIKVYTRKQFEGASPESVAIDYAPVLFGVFGACYGVSLRGLEQLVVARHPWHEVCLLLLVGHAACLVLPVLAYVTVSLLRSGESGLRSYEGVRRER